MLLYYFSFFFRLGVFGNWGVRDVEGYPNPNHMQIKINFSGLIPYNKAYNETTIEDEKMSLRKFCLANSKLNNSDNTVIKALDDYRTQVKSLINVTELKQDYSESKSNGEIDLVFKKYCAKLTKVNKYVLNFTSTVNKICQDDNEKKINITIFQNISEALLSTLCHDKDNHIPLFYTIRDPDCLMHKKESIQRCVNKSFSLNETTALTVEDGLCESLSFLQECIVAELVKCNDPESIMLVDLYFKVLRLSTPCSSLLNTIFSSLRMIFITEINKKRNTF
ncbi:Hypothetical protein CINCED_3A023775 [Cinara cedri]|uniref:Uncharacterized protein n=1 Tax=Cinara cedri TaxID=506608 RepID=A0A5E4MV58_9HEMI|nr:Hypothetical protein CINCED_3A023775 [Cinara cedri]